MRQAIANQQQIAERIAAQRTGMTLDRFFYLDEAVYQAELDAFDREYSGRDE